MLYDFFYGLPKILDLLIYCFKNAKLEAKDNKTNIFSTFIVRNFLL